MKAVSPSSFKNTTWATAGRHHILYVLLLVLWKCGSAKKNNSDKKIKEKQESPLQNRKSINNDNNN